MLPCFFSGASERFPFSIVRSSISRARVSVGSITSSTKPRSAAVYGFANSSRYSSMSSLSARVGVVGRCQFLAIEHVDGAFRPHHRDLGGRPRVVHVAADMLRRHHAVGSAVRLSGDDDGRGNRRLREGVQQLRTVADDPVVLLIGSRHEPGHVLEGEDGDVERVAEADESGALLARLDVERARVHAGLLATIPTEWPSSRANPTTMFFAKFSCTSKKEPVVDDAADHVLHVVRLSRGVGNDVAQLVVGALGIIPRARRAADPRRCWRGGTRAVARCRRARPPRSPLRSARRRRSTSG